MDQYFMHLHECGLVLADEEGNEFPDLPAAYRAAVKSAREVMADEVKHGRLCLACHIEIYDANGEMVRDVRFRDLIALTGLDDCAD